METFNTVFVHLPQHQIIVCRQCKFAVVPSQAAVHMKEHHPLITVQTRKDIAKLIQALPNVAQLHQNVKYPSQIDAPIQYLLVLRDGLECSWQLEKVERCGYVCHRLQNMQRHCKEQHGWQNTQRRGRPSKETGEEAQDKKMWVEGVTYQRFFEWAQWKRYFRVQDLQEQQTINSGVKRGEQIWEEYKKQVEEEKKKAVMQGASSRYQANPWLDFIGWEEHLQGFEKDALLKTIRPAVDEKIGDEQSSQKVNQIKVRNTEEEDDNEDEDEDEGLAVVCKASTRVIRKAIGICQPAIVGRSALEYVNRRETGEGKNEKPFYARQKVNTVKKYGNVWVKLLRYVWRTSQRERERRPEYVLTSNQEKYLGRMMKAARVETKGKSKKERQEMDEEIEEDCLRFWITMLDHELKSGEYESGIISGLAVLALETRNGGWMQAEDFTPLLSAIVTIGRAMVVYAAYTHQQKEVKKLMERGYDERGAKVEATSVFEMVKDLVEKFMTLTRFGGIPCPMDRILHMRTYGMKIRYTTKGDARVSWKGDMILIDKINFTMGDIRAVVHGLEETARERLMKELLLEDGQSGGTEVPRLDLHRLFDNAAEMAEGWNFLQDSRTSWEVEGHKWMWRRLFKEKAIGKEFIKGNTDEVRSKEEIQWNHKGIAKYMKQVSRFKEELFVLVHLSAGAPARGTEILSIQYENGASSRAQRGIFIDRGLVSFVTSYHKGYSASQQVKIIHRYVPREVGELVVYYLWLVEPFVEQMSMLAREQKEFGVFLWEPEPEEEWANEDDDEEESDGDDKEEEGGDDNQIKGKREDNRKEPKNVDGFWGTDRVRRVIKRETSKRIGVPITTAIWRQVYPAIQREWTREKEVVDVLDSVYNPEKEKEIERSAMSEQAGHSRRMEEMIYGVLLSESPFYTKSEQEGFRKVSMDWHKFLHFKSAWEEGNGKAETREKIEEEQEKEAFKRWKRIRGTDLGQELKRIVGEGAEFRGLQRPGLEAIIARHPRVLVIMRTGGGKSLFFMLPASSSRDGVTVVVVPLTSLREDLKRRCDKVGISCAEWNGKRPAYWASIVLVTPESAVTKGFSRFIDEKRMMRQLDRIVIDECHVVLDSTKEWRPQVRELVEMTEKGTQVVYLTATLPPKEEEEFFKVMGLEEKGVQIFRDKTTRRNVVYEVLDYSKEDEDEEVKKLVEEKKGQYPMPGQIIVYCKAVKQAQRLAEVLQCKAYFRAVGGEDEKRSILRSLIEGKEQVFTATNALGLGIDAPGIRVVIHVGLKERMRDYAQESGRAGRDGLKSEAIMMRGYWKRRDRKQVFEQGWKVEVGMKEFIVGTECRRVAIDKEMDGRVDRRGCEVGEEKCDICQRVAIGQKRRRESQLRSTLVEGEGSGRVGNEGSTLIEGEGSERVGDEGSGFVGSEGLGRVDDEEWEKRIKERSKEKEKEYERKMREEYKEEQRQQDIIRWRRVQERVENAMSVEEMEKVYEGWQGVCVICKASKSRNDGHTDWRECKIEASWIEDMRKGVEMIREVKFERFSGCEFCKMPQGVCDLWEDENRVGVKRYKRVRGGKCQFEGVLVEAITGIMVFGMGEEVERWVEVEQGKVGFGRETEGMSEWERWMKWLGRKRVVDGIEMSEMSRMVYMVG